MAQLTTPFKRPGDTIASAQQETVLDDLETLTAAVVANNIKQGALTTQHFDWTTTTQQPVVQKTDSMRYQETSSIPDGAAGCTLTVSGSFEDIDEDGSGNNPCEITDIATIINNGDVIEVHFSIKATYPDIANNTNDLFRFRIVFDNDLGTTHVVGPRLVYSMAGSDLSGTSSALAAEHIENRSICYPCYEIWTEGDFLLETIRIEGAVGGNTNEQILESWSLTVVIHKH
jgi:hypothetical protein